MVDSVLKNINLSPLHFLLQSCLNWWRSSDLVMVVKLFLAHITCLRWNYSGGGREKWKMERGEEEEEKEDEKNEEKEEKNKEEEKNEEEEGRKERRWRRSGGGGGGKKSTASRTYTFPMQNLQTVHITLVLTIICCTVAKLITLHTYSCKGIQNFFLYSLTYANKKKNTTNKNYRAKSHIHNMPHKTWITLQESIM